MPRQTANSKLQTANGELQAAQSLTMLDADGWDSASDFGSDFGLRFNIQHSV